MQTKYIALGVGAIILIAGGYFLTMGGGKANDEDYADDDQVQTVDTLDDSSKSMKGGGSFSGSMADLIKRGGDYKCTYASDTEAAKSSGTIYVSGTKVRGDFMSSVATAGASVDSHMIQNDGYVYTWTSAAPFGFKAKVAAGAVAPSSGSTEQYMDQNQAYSYNCSPWSVDASLFSVPTGIKFMGQ